MHWALRLGHLTPAIAFNGRRNEREASRGVASSVRFVDALKRLRNALQSRLVRNDAGFDGAQERVEGNLTLRVNGIDERGPFRERHRGLNSLLVPQAIDNGI